MKNQRWIFYLLLALLTSFTFMAVMSNTYATENFSSNSEIIEDEMLQESKIEGIDRNIVDCPPNIEESLPSKVVMQIINNTFYKWKEYKVDDNGQYCIVMEKPRHRHLTAEQAKEILEASREWTAKAYSRAYPSDKGYKIDPEKIPQEFTEERSHETEIDFEDEPPIVQRVFDDDDRQRVPYELVTHYPYNTIGKLEFRFPDFSYPPNTHHRGTGFLISPHTIMTCAHNVFNDERGGMVDWIRFFPGQYQSSENAPIERPYGERYASDWDVDPMFISTDEDQYDIAALFIDDPFDSIDTYMPLAFDVINEPINSAGYPVEVQDEESSNAQWSATGGLYDGHFPPASDRILAHYIDATGGQSGSPVFLWHGDWDFEVIALITYSGVFHNGGPRLVSQNKDMIEDWMNWEPDDLPDPGDSDLIVESLTVEPLSSELGTELTATIVIKNQGDADVTESFWVDFYEDQDSEPIAGDESYDYYKQIDFLAAGATEEVEFKFSPDEAGSKQAWAQVDTEEHHGDTHVYGPVNYTVSEEGESGPDLIVQSVTVEPVNSELGTELTATIVIINQGDSGAENFINDFYEDRISEPDPMEFGDYAWVIDYLAAGATHTYTYQFTPDTAGDKKAWAQADTDQDVSDKPDVYGPVNYHVNDSEPENYTLSVNSINPSSGVSISSNSGHSGTTSYTRTVEQGTSVNLTAPQYVGEGESRKSFSNWSGDVYSSDRTINLTMDENKTVTANYIDDPDTISDPAFSDVPTDHPFFIEIETLVAAGVAEGYDDGTFRPSANITRMAMAAFLVRGLELEDEYEVPAEPTFPDVPIDHPFFDEIELLAASGISDGYEDGTFRPSANVTRMAMAAFLSRALELGQDYEVPAEPTFPDVLSDHPFYEEIELLAASGIAEGYDDGTFRPSANVTRMAMAAFLFRGLGLEE